MVEKELTKIQLLDLKAQIEVLHRQFGLSVDTRSEVYTKINILYKNAPE